MLTSYPPARSPQDSLLTLQGGLTEAGAIKLADAKPYAELAEGKGGRFANHRKDLQKP